MPETLSSTRSTVQGRWTVDARWTVDQPNRCCPYSRARVSGPRTWPDRNAQLCAGLDPRTWPDRKVSRASAVSFQRACERGKVLNRKLQTIVDYGLKVGEYFANPVANLAKWQSPPQLVERKTRTRALVSIHLGCCWVLAPCCCCDSSSGWYGAKPFLPAISARRI